jgi:SAM-dependent methyltransferase
MSAMVENFVVPERFNRNAENVRALGGPAFTGKVLLDYMTARLGWKNLAGKRVLDIGCGSCFASTIRTYDTPVGQYIGVDVDREMIDWLQRNAALPHLSFHLSDHRNPLYNPTGSPEPDWSFAIDMDVCCMFSVITHQLPVDALAIFREARRRIAGNGFMFFSAHIHSTEDDYREMEETPTALSSYSRGHIERLLAEAGWNIFSEEPPNPPFPASPIIVPILNSFVCVPRR